MQWVHGLHFNNLRGDIYGGLTAAVVALPLALAMGVSSGAGPIAGIYGAIFVGLFAALFGGTPSQVSGPTGPMTVVMAVIFTEYTSMFPDDPAYGASLAFTIVIMGGLFQILFGIFKLGKYINLIPHPVTSGFMSGIGVIIILLQIGPLFGHMSLSGPLDSLKAAPQILENPVYAATMVSVLALIIVYLLPKKINALIPSPLFALIAGTLALYLWQGGDIVSSVENGRTIYKLGEVSVLGNIPTGFPSPQLPVFDITLIAGMIKSALILAALGSIDSLLTSLVADSMTRTYHESNRELVGQGIGNTLSGFFGGLPGAGATMRTVVNIRAGGQTPISGALHALVLLAIVLGAGAVAQYIPHALLAGILIKVGTDIIDWNYLKRLRHAPKPGVLIMFTVLFSTVFVDLIFAVALGMIMASFLFMQRMASLQIDSMTAVTSPEDIKHLSDEESALLDNANGRILYFHISGPMGFAAAKGMARRLVGFDGYDALIIDLSDVPQIDFTSTRALDDIIHDARDSGREVYLTGCRDQICDMLVKQDVIDAGQLKQAKQSLLDTLKHASQNIKDH